MRLFSRISASASVSVTMTSTSSIFWTSAVMRASRGRLSWK